MALVAVGACDSAEVVGPPGGMVRSVAVTPREAHLTYLGETVRFTAAVRRDSGAVGGSAVRWESSDETVVSVDGTGQATARGNGRAEVRASLEGVSGSATVTVAQRPTSLSVFGDGQSALAGLRLPGSVGVQVQDAGGRPVSGLGVRFSVASGGGSVDPDTATTDGSGVASVAWTLGAALGEQRLAVSAGGLGADVRATAVDPNSVVARVVVWSGGRQEGVAGRPLPEPVVVQALDAATLPVPGALVRFAPDAGDGSAVPTSARTDSAGQASTEWTLGASEGDQRLRVSVGASSPALEVTATAHPDRGICARTPAVVVELLEETGAANCADVTAEQLAAVKTLFLEEKNIERLRVGDFAGLSSLVWLLLEGNRLSVLPPGIFSDLTSLWWLNLDRNQLESLPPSMLASLPALTRLELEANRFTEIPAGLAGLTRLTSLELSDNPLKGLPSGLFAGMERLEQLRLGNIGLEELPPELFRGLSRLTGLWLFRNGLTRLPAGVFDDLRSLEALSLFGNQLTELPPGVFKNLPELGILWLTDNRLRDLDEDVFAGLSKLGAVRLEGNELAELPPDVFAGLSSLRQLRLDGNRLTALPPDIFTGLSRLYQLRLEGNELAGLPRGLFAGLSALEVLRLWGNRLTVLPPDIFAGLGKLRRLELNRNDLPALPDGVFNGLGSLAELDLFANDLEELPPGVFVGLSELQQLDLGGNPGAPFPLTVELGRTDTPDVLAPGPARVVARIPSGAPISLTIPVSVQGGSASGADFTVAAGDTASAALEVRRPPGGSGAAHVSLGAASSLPTGFSGVEWVPGGPVALFAPPGNRPPAVTEEIPEHWMTAGGRTAEVDLGDHFSDADGDTLVHGVRTNDAAVATATIEDGVLVLTPLTEGSAVIEVTAQDPAGLRAVLEVRVTVAPPPDPTGYDIELIFDDGFTPAEEREIRRAAARWEEVVTGDLPAVPVDHTGLFCRDSQGRRLVGAVDDVLIKFSVQPENRVRLASAAGCVERESGLPLIETVRFNRRYFGPDTQYDVYSTALHEIGHNLGIGSRPWLDILQGKTGDEPLDTHFPGPLAVEAFNEAGGRPYTGRKVPVEVRNVVHWRNSVLSGELMSPHGYTLSAITVQALADLGYEVDVSRADPYTLPGADRAPGADAEALPLFADDVIEGPVIVVDENGRIVRIIGGN
ncbi:MAG: Ig-like domain-containing protein [Gemmatimonadota bacterium]|uniref:Ig-like domain-containing protein n=1 Tax=Candidatus Palauibacter scopulicola TaxID=3056741 RepID=UPI00239AEF2B|nr:Ig-like domain-containing protein [Candidatus Palauibacter scopulicola]MDE2663881.1 Ig-like domain-containing protein [Candidatus Palauibacter scopulicola]